MSDPLLVFFRESAVKHRARSVGECDGAAQKRSLNIGSGSDRTGVRWPTGGAFAPKTGIDVAPIGSERLSQHQPFRTG
jgi:hypothetical protein